MRLELATAEYIGARAQQQDHAAAVPLKAGALLVLADGLGGHESGAEAARIVVETFREAANAGSFDVPERRRSALRDAVERANARIGEGVDPAHGHRGMASTAVAAVVADGELNWVSVGDSHLYVWREGRLAKLNEDHSQAGLMVKSGQYRPGDPEVLAVKSVLVSALTGRKLEIVDLPERTFKVESGDVLMLASDGLNTLDDEEIARIVADRRADGSVKLSTVLLETVRGRRVERQDNTTVCVARVLSSVVRPSREDAAGQRTITHQITIPTEIAAEARTERISPVAAEIDGHAPPGGTQHSDPTVAEATVQTAGSASGAPVTERAGEPGEGDGRRSPAGRRTGAAAETAAVAVDVPPASAAGTRPPPLATALGGAPKPQRAQARSDVRPGTANETGGGAAPASAGDRRGSPASGNEDHGAASERPSTSEKRPSSREAVQAASGRREAGRPRGLGLSVLGTAVLWLAVAMTAYGAVAWFRPEWLGEWGPSSFVGRDWRGVGKSGPVPGREAAPQATPAKGGASTGGSGVPAGETASPAGVPTLPAPSAVPLKSEAGSGGGPSLARPPAPAAPGAAGEGPSPAAAPNDGERPLLEAPVEVPRPSAPVPAKRRDGT